MTNLNNKKSEKNRGAIVTIIFLILISALISLIVVNTIIGIAKYPEENSGSAWYQLRAELNEGNAERIEYYKETYIARDVYLYDGPLTLKLMAEKYDLDYQELSNSYKNSGYNSVQKYFDEYLKDIIK